MLQVLCFVYISTREREINTENNLMKYEIHEEIKRVLLLGIIIIAV